MTNAYQDKITRLYHYERFIPKRLVALLREQRVHCSNPDKLNDPWDCRPFFDTSCLSDPEEKERNINWFQTMDRAVPMSAERQLYISRLMNDDANFLPQLINSLSEQFMEIVPQRWCIYCLTPHPDSTLMWSHYADNHKGVCLEFSSDTNTMFASALKVMYRTVYPRWSPHSLEHVVEILLTKSDD
jgi:Protein of unknown function (DUF2971)